MSTDTMTKTRPILFTGAMVRALLAGTKTQTRRLVKPQPVPAKDAFWERMVGQLYDTDWVWHRSPGCSTISNSPTGPDGYAREFCPYGVPGDRLWVRETWAPEAPGLLSDGLTGRFMYRADASDFTDPPKDGRWRPSIHMPREVSRLTLEITGVRVQRLHDITNADARAEGLSVASKDNGTTWKYGIADRDGLPGNDDDGWHWASWFTNPIHAYAALWETINGVGSWDANPWLWAINFRRLP